jgi:hypothetical protein
VVKVRPMLSGIACATFFDFFSFFSSFFDLRDSDSLLKDVRGAPISMFDAAQDSGAERERERDSFQANMVHASHPPSSTERNKIITRFTQAGT